MSTMNTAQVRSEFAIALNQIATERGIDVNRVIAAVENAIVSAYRKDIEQPLLEGETERFTASLDPITGEAHVFEEKDGKKVDVTPAGFGRIAAQTAKQVILQQVREAERDSILSDFSSKIGTIISAMVLRYDGKNVIFDVGRGQAIMPPEEQMRGEFYRMNSRLTVYVADIRETLKGRSIIVSRAAKELVRELFAREVPEVSSGAVEIKGLAREAGVRSKIAVFSSQKGVDPVGSCVGQKGVRVQEVIRELNNEKIDIIQYSENPSEYLRAALAPAESLKIEIDAQNNSAVVTAPDDQVSLAIGRGGQNVRLAAKLTGYKITVNSESGTQAAIATGNEEFEIDQLQPHANVREVLVNKGYTALFQVRDHLDELESSGAINAKDAAELRERLAFAAPKPVESTL